MPKNIKIRAHSAQEARAKLVAEGEVVLSVKKSRSIEQSRPGGTIYVVSVSTAKR